MRVRKVLIAVTATAILLAVVALGAIGVDYGTSIYAEYRLSASVRKAANLGSDPFVAIVAFPSFRRPCAATTTRWRSRPTPSNTR